MIKNFLLNWILAPKSLCVVCRVLSRIMPQHATVLPHKRSTNRIFVIANGPSLKQDIPNFQREIEESDRIVVNFFGNNDLFSKIKPTHYVLVDPVFSTDPELLTENLKKGVLNLQSAFINKVTWHMELVVPYAVRNCKFIATVRKNKMITILFLNNSIDFPLASNDFEGLSKCRYNPPAQNVVNTAIYLGVIWHYQQVFLIGADTSFHTMAHVEQDTNLLYILDEHFYGTEKRYMYKDPVIRTPQTMSCFFEHVQRAFAWYEKLRKFADYSGVQVINACSFSWIDTFDRPASLS